MRIKRYIIYLFFFLSTLFWPFSWFLLGFCLDYVGFFLKYTGGTLRCIPIRAQRFFMINTFKGILSATILAINTLIMVPLLLIFALLKLVLAWPSSRRFLSKVLTWIATLWVSINSGSFRLIHGDKIKLKNMPDLSMDQWYLVVSNHQSTADIPILQAAFNRRIPFLKFFLKQELIWVPLLGLAWWALDFPFMKRYSRAKLEKHPHLRGKDMEQTQRSCEKFKHFPTAVINFVEGTRFTPKKQQRQQSPYTHLLKPKAGGLGYVLGSMGECMNQLLLVTLAYRPQVPGFWDYLSGNFEAVEVLCEKIVIPDTLLNKNYQIDEKFRAELFKWSEKMWYKQDDKLKAFYERSNIQD